VERSSSQGQRRLLLLLRTLPEALQTLGSMTVRAENVQLPVSTRVAVSLWAATMVCSELRTIVPYVHWYVTVILIVFLSSKFLGRGLFRTGCLLLPAVLLCASVALVSAISADPIHDLTQSGKFFVILFLVLPILAGDRRLLAALMDGVEWAMYLNTV